MHRLTLRWLQLLALSGAFSALAQWLGLPASFLLGPLVAAVFLTLRGSTVRVARFPFLCAQGIVGCLLGRSVPHAFLDTVAGHGWVLLTGAVGVTVVAFGLGWALSRWHQLPLPTAIWGSAPGGASAMMVLAEGQGADMRLVALMQYLRVVCVSVTATLVAHAWGTGSGVAAHPQGPGLSDLLAAPAAWAPLLLGLAVAVGGAWLGSRLRVPAGTLLVPMALFIAVRDGANLPLELHPLVLVLAYACIGWTVGTRFDRSVITACLDSLPKVFASVVALIVLCAAWSAALVRWAGVDPLTAYLATSPGGADIVAIIATSSPVDLTFVLAMQVSRMVFVVVCGPLVAKLITRA